MLGKKSNEKPCNTIDTLIGAKAELKGDIDFTGGLRVDGKVKGNITGKGGGNSTLVLSEHAEIVGDVAVPHMIVNGRIKGNVHCSERIELQPKAEIVGEVHYKVIEMALGAAINGNLVHETGQAVEKGEITKLKSVATSASTDTGADSDS
ncbi:MAG: polymer-forming cytoskeletal protein [Acidiferrobacterales bacterium]